MSPKRIAMISYHTCPLASQEGKETGGMNIYVLETARELAKMGHTIDVFTRCQDIHNEKIVHVAENLRVIHIPAGPQKAISRKKLAPFLDEFVTNCNVFIENEKTPYDVFHSHYYLSGLIGLKMKEKQSHIPLIMSFHTLGLMKNLVARSEHEKEEKFRIDAEFLLTEKADVIINPSESDALYMKYLYNAKEEKLAVIPPGINRDRFHPIEKDIAKQQIQMEYNKKIVLFVGRIEPLKGIDALIYAIKILVVRNPSLPVKLLIVGGDISQKKELWTKELQSLEQLTTTLSIPDVVKFVGQTPQDKLRFYYNSAELVVMPSHYESFGMTALEAMACGVPVITSNVSGVASIIDEKHGSLITTVNNPLLLAAQIEEMLINKDLHEKVSKDIRESVSDLTWHNTAEQILAAYKAQ